MLLVTYRNLVKNRTYTFINIIGLALGITAFIIISAYVHFEKSFDRMHTDAGKIYRVESQFYKGGELTDNWATSTNGYGPAMKANMPEIASFTRINWNNSERVVRYREVKFREQHVCFADTNFFKFFSFHLVKGDAATVLKDVNTIAISESSAKKYFGSVNPMGKFLEISTLSDSYHCMVTGIFKDVPPNSSMQFNFLVSWPTSLIYIRDFWYMHESYTFVKLKPYTTPAAVEDKFPALAEKYKTGLSLKELKWAIQLVPLTDVHLNPAKQYDVETNGNRNAVNFLQVLAYVILTIACVNYINLATTKAIDRAREVGIRKVSGANSLQLIFQFLLESVILNAIALLISIIMVIAANYYLPDFLGTGNSAGLLFDGYLYQNITIVIIAGILLSGIYPATVLARVKPIVVLKGRYAFSKSGILLRKGMVAFQFTASLLLIAGTFAVYRQIIYMSSQKTGININQTIILKAPVNTPNYAQKVKDFKNTLQAIPGVTAVTGSGAIPGKEVGKFLANRKYGAPKTDERLYEMLRVDYDFMQAYGLELVAGRAFDKNRPADSTGVILNEASVKQFGFATAQAAIGQKVWLETLEKKPNEVIGVIKNYHQQSLQQKYTPIILFMDPALGWIPTDYYSVKVANANVHSVVPNLKQVWNSFFPESSFDFFFLDDSYNRQYLQDLQFGRIFMLFSSLAIFIACMGLFGLTAYSTARRNKEIGVRKVLGASVSNIMSLLTIDLVKLILICSIIAIPAAYLLIEQWLQGYAFRVGLIWWQFVLPVLSLMVIAVCTISYLTYKAALSNPVVTLRDE
ncbi:MAG: transporter permease [Mucilaginibacter sp.]|nr:transporter permease [Mucilaginibacter sp.]